MYMQMPHRCHTFACCNIPELMLKGTILDHVYCSYFSATHVVEHTCFMNVLLRLKHELRIFGVVTLRGGEEEKKKQ